MKYWSASATDIPWPLWDTSQKTPLENMGNPCDGFPDVENGAVLKSITIDQKDQKLSCSC